MSEEKYFRVPFDYLEEFIKAVFVKIGVPKEDATICANVLITSDKRGIESHGIARLKDIYYDKIKIGMINPNTTISIIRESPTTAVIDGNNGLGHAIGYKSMDIAIKKAKQYGMGMTAVRNSSHYGIAGYFALQAVKHGMIGMTGTNARPSVAPTFGVENMMGTNPFTFGIPTDEDFPFVFDAATSLTQRGKIETYARKNLTMPEGWVIDQNGDSLTDAKAVLDMLIRSEAALTPIGGSGETYAGYKGYAFGLVVEILSSALQAGNFLKMLSGFKDGEKVPTSLGHFFIAIDVNAFAELHDFQKHTGKILREIRNSKKAKGADRIYTPGEKEHLYYTENASLGAKITLPTALEMIKMREETGLMEFTFDFEKEL